MRRVEKIASRRSSNSEIAKGPMTRKADKRANSLGIEVCEVCQNCFYSKSSLAVHKRVHYKNEYFDCDICRKRFMTLSSLQGHKKVHAAANKMSDKVLSKSKKILSAKKSQVVNRGHSRCNVCGKFFGNRVSLANHKRIHVALKSKIKPVKAETKQQSPKRAENKKPKMAGTTLKCGFCQTVFMSERGLNAHIVSAHNQEKWLGTQRAKRSRSNSHEDVVSCDLCSKVFSNALGVKNHKNKVHGIEGKLAGRKETSTSAAEDKSVIHLSFHCYICNEKFTSSTHKSKKYRKAHLESHKDSEGRLQCKFCPAAFTKSRSFSNHQRMHSAEVKSGKIVSVGSNETVKPAKSHVKPKKAIKRSVDSRARASKTLPVTPRSRNPVSVTGSAAGVERKTPATPFRPTRSRRTPGSSNAAKNVLFNMDENFKCGICTKEFSSHSNLEMHKKTHLKDDEDSESVSGDTGDSNQGEECMESVVLVEKLNDKLLDSVQDSVSESENSTSVSEECTVANKNDSETKNRGEDREQSISEEIVSDNSEEIIVDVDDAKIAIEKEFAKDCGVAVECGSSFAAASGTDIEIVPLEATINTVEVEVSAGDLKPETDDVVPLVSVDGSKSVESSSEKASAGSSTNPSAKINSPSSAALKTKVGSPNIVRIESPCKATIITLKEKQRSFPIIPKEKQNNLSIIPKEKQNSPSIIPREKQTSPLILAKDKKTIPSLLSKDRKIDSSISSKEKQTSASIISKEKQNNPSIITKEKQNNPSIITKEKLNNPSIITKEKQNNPSINKEKQNKPSIMTKEKQNNPSLIAKEKPTSLLSKEKPTSTSISLKDKQTSSSKEKDTIPGETVKGKANSEAELSSKSGEKPSLTNGGNVKSSNASSESNVADVNSALKTGSENVGKSDEQKDSENTELKGIIAFINNDFGVSTE